MKFGKEFKTHLEQTLPEWRDKFLCYKPLKKLLKHYPNLPSTLYPIPTNHSLNFLLPPLQPPPVSFDDLTEAAPCETAAAASLADLQDWFVRILNEELEKLNDFYVDKEEEFVIRFQVLLLFPFFVFLILLGFICWCYEYVYTICVLNLGLLFYCFFFLWGIE